MKKATHIYYNGQIITMDSRGSIVRAMAVCEDTILALGSLEELEIYKDTQTKSIDLKNKTMLPGFYDAHSHFMRAGMYDKYYVNVHAKPIGQMSCQKDLFEALQSVAVSTPKGEWILAAGYDDTAMKEQSHITLKQLDEMFPDHPLFIRHISGHLAVCNSLAFEIAGINENTPNPVGAVFCKDIQGNFTGLVEEPNAMEEILAFVPAMTEEKWLASIEHINEIYLSKGVTTAHEGGVTTAMWQNYMKAQEKNILKVRVQLLPRHTGFDFNLVHSTKSGFSLCDNDMLSLGAVKIFQDGSIQGYTGYLSIPYTKVVNEQIRNPENWCGYPIYDAHTFTEQVIQYHCKGWQIAVHGNGDNCIEDIINAFEAAQKIYPRHNARHIIIHCQTVREDQLDRIKRLGIIPSFFVTHTYYWGDRHRDIFLGEDRAKRINPLKSALDRDIIFTNHNDTPVTPINPLLSVWSSVNRITSSGHVLGEHQCINVIDALRSVTIWSAYQFNEDNKKGSLEPGKLADMVILEDNPLCVEPIKIKDIPILATIIGNKLMYGALD